MQKSKIKSFGASAIILAIGSLICKIIGAIYRIPLTNLLGAQGIGVYQTVFPLFTILLTLSSGGITSAISALLAGSTPDERYGLLKASAYQVGLIGFIVSSATFLLSSFFANIQGIPTASLGYKVLAPVILISGFSAILKGYFQSKSTVFPTMLSNLIEQIAKLFSGLFLGYLLLPRGIEYAIFGALCGTLFGEVCSLLFLLLRYAFSKDKPRKTNQISISYDFFRVFRAVLPLSLGGLILPVCALFDSISVINLLAYTNGSTAIATAKYGLLSGTVATITNLPVVFTLALGVTVTPTISAEKSTDGILQKANLSTKLALFVCVPLSLLLLVLSRPIISFLYPSLSTFEQTLSSNLLALSTLTIAPLGITQIYSSLLYSTGLGAKSTQNLIYSTIIKCLLTPIALLLFDVYGACLVSAISYLVSATLNYRTWKKVFGKNQNFTQALTKVLLIGIIAILPLFILSKHINFLFSIGLSALVMVLYLYTTVKFGVFSAEEKESLPFLKLIRTQKENK